MRMGEAINDMKKWMSSDSSEDDEAPEEINFGVGKASAISKSRKEQESKRKQKDELKRKRQEIEERNVNQKKARLALLPQELLDEVQVEADANERKKTIVEDTSAGGTSKDALGQTKKKRAPSSKRLRLPESDYQFIPLSGVKKISNRLLYKNKEAAFQLNFKERMLSNNKRVKREKVGQVLGNIEKQRVSQRK